MDKVAVAKSKKIATFFHFAQREKISADPISSQEGLLDL